MKLSSIFDPESMAADLILACASVADDDYETQSAHLMMDALAYFRVNVDAEFPEPPTRRVVLGPGTVEINGLRFRAMGFEVIDVPAEAAAFFHPELKIAFIEDAPSLPPKMDTSSAARRSVITKHMKKRGKR